MALRMQRTNVTPPGDWKVIDPDSGATIKGGDYENLLGNVAKHRRANQLPPLTALEIEQIICDSLPPRADNCISYDPSALPSDPLPERATIDMAISFIKFLGISLARGAGFVAQEEAERRAKICASCPNNVLISGCTSCRNLLTHVTEHLAGRTTQEDDRLKGCRICGCELKVSVHADLEAQQKATPARFLKDFPVYCWKAPQSV